MLFEMLTGSPPHQAPTLEGVLVAICTEDAPDIGSLRPDAPVELADAVARALAKNREQRWPSAGEFLEALTPRGGLAAMRRRRRRVPGTLVAGTLATLVGFTLTAAFVARRADPPSPPPSAGPELPAIAAPVALDTIAPPATSAPAASAAAAPAKPAPSLEPAASGSAVLPSRPRSSAPERARVSPGGRPKSVAARDAGIANSLQLSTREP